MSVFPFLLALRREMENFLSALPLEENRKNADDLAVLSPARVYIGQLPPRSRADTGAFVLLQPLSGGQDENGCQIVELAIRVCVFNSGLEGAENDLFNLLELIRRELSSFRKRALADRYVLTEGDRGLLPWTRPDDQAPPFLEAFIISNWKLWGYE